MCPDPDLVRKTAEEAGDPMEIAADEITPEFELPPPEETAEALNAIDRERELTAQAAQIGRHMSPPHQVVPGQKDITIQEIATRFTYHPLKGNQPARYESLRNSARDLALLICTETPTSREQSMALTHLEQAIMFANAAIARRE